MAYQIITSLSFQEAIPSHGKEKENDCPDCFTLRVRNDGGVCFVTARAQSETIRAASLIDLTSFHEKTKEMTTRIASCRAVAMTGSSPPSLQTQRTNPDSVAFVNVSSTCIRNSSLSALLKVICMFLFPCMVMAQYREVTDMAGRRVGIPEKVDRVFTDRFLSLVAFALDPAMTCNATFRVSEAGRKYISEMYYVNKPLTENNEEELLKLRPDVILLSFQDEASREAAGRMQAKLRIPVLLVKFGITDYRDAYGFLGQTLGRQATAGRIIDFLDKYLLPLHEQTGKIPAGKRPSVYYAEGSRGLNTEAAGSLHSQVIDYLHARNVATVTTGSIHGMAAVTAEQVLMWNPDVIIVWSGFPSGAGLPQEAKKEKSTREHILTDPVWQQTGAVANKQVYQVPSQPFGWIDRPPSVNCVPGVLWLAHRLFPEICTFDLNTALKECFRLFYHVEITDQDIKYLLENECR
ncbi:MAG: ABC transporter substrate-binding protein [Tannerella sp.]|jgi:iron complex transport system substrate-binding protein|nr:ABC transporter substrate-binding protein [Tannerella sp.]